MGVLSAPQRVEVLSGGTVGGTIMGARGCAAGELDLGPGGGFRAGRGPAGRGWEVVLGGGALGAKSRAPRGWCGGPGEVRPLRPTPRSSRRTLGAPEPSPVSRPAQKESRARAAGEGPRCGERVSRSGSPPLQWEPRGSGPPKS